jgi:hypothetical protein
MSVCRSCGTPLVWAATERGNSMPLEPDPTGHWLYRAGMAVPIGGTVRAKQGERRYTPHFASCPEADTWRRRR